MKKLIILFLILLPTLAQAQEFPLLARMNPYILGAGVAASVAGVVGHTTAPLADNQTLSADLAVVFPTTATESGELDKGYAYHGDNSYNDAVGKICVYNRSGTTISGDETLVGGSDAITVTTGNSWFNSNASAAGYNVTKDSTYWIMLYISSSTPHNWVISSTYATGSFYKTSVGTYPSCPTTLGASWTGGNFNPSSYYFTTK